MITEVYKQTLEIFCTGRNHDYSESNWYLFNDIFIVLQFLKLKCNYNISLFPPANFTNVLTWSLSSSRLVYSLVNSWLHMCMLPTHTNMHTCIPKFENATYSVNIIYLHVYDLGANYLLLNSLLGSSSWGNNFSWTPYLLLSCSCLIILSSMFTLL